MFAGDDRFVADYLRVGDPGRPEGGPGARLFLTRTAVLDELCGPLCDQLLGSRGSTGQAGHLGAIPTCSWCLSTAGVSGTAITGCSGIPCSPEPVRAEPDIVPELHGRAADWYEANRRPEEAIEHARASGDSDRAALLVGRCFQPVFFSGRLTTNYRWLAEFSKRRDRAPPVVGCTRRLGLCADGPPSRSCLLGWYSRARAVCWASA